MAPPSANDYVESTAPLDPPSSPESLGSAGGSDTGVFPFSLIDRTLTLYDWDDTFLPSTYLATLGLRVDDVSSLPSDLSSDLSQLESQVIKMLEESLRYGAVKVVTNAEEGWVELSGARFMPKLTAFLKERGIKVISARSQYEVHYPESPSSWKTAAFVAEVDASFPDEAALNVLVLGDSLSERDAAHALAGRLPAACVKSVKLVERPNVAQLHRQIQLLHRSFRDLRDHLGSFDVNLTC